MIVSFLIHIPHFGVMYTVYKLLLSKCDINALYLSVISTVPIITASNVVVNEDGGVATVDVILENEIENELSLDFSTSEVPNGADGMT